MAGEPFAARGSTHQHHHRGPQRILPAGTNHTLGNIARGKVIVGSGGHNCRALAAGSPHERQVGAPLQEVRRRLVLALHQHALDALIDDQLPGELILTQPLMIVGGQLHEVRR